MGDAAHIMVISIAAWFAQLVRTNIAWTRFLSLSLSRHRHEHLTLAPQHRTLTPSSSSHTHTHTDFPDYQRTLGQYRACRAVCSNDGQFVALYLLSTGAWTRGFGR